MGKEIRPQIVDFIVTNFLFDEGEKTLNETESLLESGVIDSTGVLELVAFIEETYQIRIEDEEIMPENLDSVENIVTFVSYKLSQLQSRQTAAS